MTDIKTREQKMQACRKNTPWKEFVMEITSRCPLVFHRTQGKISRYPDTNRIGTIVDNKQFDGERDSLTKNFLNLDSQKSLFTQIGELFLKIPLGAMIIQNAGENTNYADSVVGSSNSYLSSVIINDCSDILYSFIVFNYCKNVVDSVWVSDYSENIFRSVAITKSSSIFYSRYITNSSNIRFSSNLVGCHDCIFCDRLQNKSYCIENKEYSKEEYVQKKEEILADKATYSELYAKIDSSEINLGSENVKGSYNSFGKNISNGYYTNRLENGNNTICVGGENQEKNFFDTFDSGVGSYDMYGIEGAGSNSNNVYNSTQVENSSRIYYSYNLISCSYCIGCVGLKNQQFCILNKQYTKDERFEKANEIFAQMEIDGTLGKFLPGSMNPFYFNDTAACLIDDNFTKEEVTQAGFLRRDEEIKVDIPEGSQVVETSKLNEYQGFNSEGKREINPEILKKVIKDKKGNSYRIVKLEYDFLMKYGLPLPEIHWLDRIKLGFKFK